MYLIYWNWGIFMYNEKLFKITILFTRIRRYLFIFAFVIASLIGAYLISEFLTEIARLPNSITVIIMVATGVVVFLLGFILTSNLEFKVQEAQLEMKILKKINVVSYKLDKLLEKSGISISDEIYREMQQQQSLIKTDVPRKTKFINNRNMIKQK